MTNRSESQIADADPFECGPRAGDEEQGLNWKTPQRRAEKPQLAHLGAIGRKRGEHQRQRSAIAIAANFQQSPPFERTQERSGQIAIVHFVRAKWRPPQERVSRAIRPPAIETRGQRERVAGIDAVESRDLERLRSEAFGDAANRAGAVGIRRDGVAANAL